MSYTKDLIERAAVAYGTTFTGALLADGFDLMDVSSLRAAAVAAIPAAITVLYGWLAGFSGNPDTAGFTDSRNK